MKLSERDYSGLKGTEVLVGRPNKDVEGFVAGIDYEVGISILNISNPDHELICLNKKYHDAPLNYNGAFAHLVAYIKNGYVPNKLADKVLRRDRTFLIGDGQMRCAFK